MMKFANEEEPKEIDELRWSAMGQLRISPGKLREGRRLTCRHVRKMRAIQKRESKNESRHVS